MQIFVLGMHRSGTSAVTRLINLLGAYVGTEDALWGASDENPKGFWERKDSQLLNQAIIESVGANWDRVSEFNIDKLADAAKTAFKGQAANILVKLEQFRPWVMKDPRLCLTFPFWQALLECPICVIPYRNPIEVAQSLRTRNGFPIPFGLALWESYLLAALKASQGVPRYFLSYNALIDNSFDEVEKLCGWLQSAGVRRLEMPSQEEVTAFLDPGLRRERSANSLLDDSLSCRQKQVFDALESRSDKAINLLTTDLSVSAAGTLRLYEDFADLSNKFPGLKKANEQKSKEIGTLRASMCNIETALSASRTRQQALEVQFESQEARISLLCNEVSAERNSRAQEVKNCEDEIKKLTVEFQTERQMSERSFKRAIERLESKLKEEEDRAKDLEIKLDDQNKASVQLASEITYRLEQMASEHCALSQERDKFLIERERLINENTAEIGRLNDRATGLMVALEVERYFTQCSAEYRRLAVRRRTALGIAKLINNLDKSIAQILKSRRWKTGNLLVGRIGRRITFQRPRSLDWLDQRRAKSMRVASEWLDSRLSYYDNIFASKELRWQQSLEDGEEKSRQLASEVASAAESCKRELDQLTGNAALLLKALEALLKSRSWRVGSFIINDVLKILFFRSRRQKNWGFEQLCTGRDQLRQFAVEVSHNTDDEKKTHVELRTSSLPAPTGRQREWRDSSQIEGKISVVIPIYDAYEETKSCLHSVLHHIHPRNEVILIDDASPDDRIWRLLEEFSSEFENVIAIRNKENIGFTRTVNKGFRIAKGDVVILNSDTEVTPMWLEKLKNAAYSRPRVATVTPLTNSGSAFAIPVNHTANNLPSFLTPNGVNALLESISTRRRPKVPTGNGFCMYIRREALDEVGYFDEDSFPRGYGEENDFCLRAAEAGYVNLIDDTTFIYHKESASFGVEKQSLIERATKRINELHPGYNAVIQDWLRNDELTELRIQLQKYWNSPDLLPKSVALLNDVRSALLFIVHDGTGGTPQHLNDIISECQDIWRCLVLKAGGDRWVLSAHSDGFIEKLKDFEFERAWMIEEKLDSERELALEYIIQNFKPVVAHIHHLLGSAPDVIHQLKNRNCGVVYSFHDLYAVCPSYNLLDHENSFCGGRCTPGIGRCEVTVGWARYPFLKHSYVYRWREAMLAALMRCDRLISFSDAVRGLIVDHFPDLEGEDYAVVPHGVDTANFRTVVAPLHQRPIRIVIVGALGPHKGTKLIGDVLRLNHDKKGPFEFHIVGPYHPEFDPKKWGAVTHGPYQRADLPQILEGIQPSFAMIASITFETFCFTLSECWAAGLPVFGSDIGTIKERIEQTGGGWVLDFTRPEKWYEDMLKVADNVTVQIQARESVLRIKHRSVKEMSKDYKRIYSEVAARNKINLTA